jgi:transitional endoplasmic reticulum ATPase
VVEVEMTLEVPVIVAQPDPNEDGPHELEKNVFIVSATNKPDQIDSALLRPGRLDWLIYIPLPGEASRLSTFKAALNKSPVAPEINFLVFLAKSRDLLEGKLIICERIDSDIRRQWENRAKEMAAGDGTQDGRVRGPCLTNHKVVRFLFHSFIVTEHFEEAMRYAHRLVSAQDIRRHEMFSQVCILHFTAATNYNRHLGF